MDIIAQISKYLTDNASLNGLPVVSPLLNDGSSIAIRESPSSIANRYMNSGKTFNFQFQILVKDPSVINTRKIINDIFKKLDGLSNGAITSADGSFSFTKCECTTSPNFVEKTEQNYYIYTALFNAELEIGR
ncbi:minor capsid protein [Metabacillus sp. FJAT-53654]|uniref:Minor capsid protein n=1 Tax=Metabacillus rhizosphaerae TaxID=3117747 RepID=A0ABZ2MZ71_9BACI